MDRPVKVLVPVDDSEATDKAVARTALHVRERRVTGVVLLHVLPPTPPRLLEHGGGETRVAQATKDDVLRQERERWIVRQKDLAAPVFARARGTLEAVGLAPDAIEEVVSPAVHFREVARHAHEVARARACEMVVVGRTSLPWYRDLVERQVADDLEASAAEAGIRVEVVA